MALSTNTTEAPTRLKYAMLVSELLETQELALRNPILSDDIRHQLIIRHNELLEESEIISGLW
jgi:hypothetical protein